MKDWAEWLRNLFWQPPEPDGLRQVEKEVDELKADVAGLQERTSALEAFRGVAKGARR